MSQTGKLLIVPTPLGNLGDVTRRSREAFATCDVVCCEDTRVTGRLLAALGLSKRMERLDEATISHASSRIVARVLEGEVVAYASDAGMPGVSDPGLRLVDEVREAGGAVEVLPGPTAVTCAYVASGFSAQSFYFGAFFPRKAGERDRLLEALKPLEAVLVFYESPRRLVSALECLAIHLPKRRIAVCRELTKIHEEVVRGRAWDLLAEFSERERKGQLKGEVVIVIDAPGPDERTFDADQSKKRARAKAASLIGDGRLSNKEIAKSLQDEFGLSRNEAYALVLDQRR